MAAVLGWSAARSAGCGGTCSRDAARAASPSPGSPYRFVAIAPRIRASGLTVVVERSDRRRRPDRPLVAACVAAGTWRRRRLRRQRRRPARPTEAHVLVLSRYGDSAAYPPLRQPHSRSSTSPATGPARGATDPRPITARHPPRATSPCRRSPRTARRVYLATLPEGSGLVTGRASRIVRLRPRREQAAAGADSSTPAKAAPACDGLPGPRSPARTAVGLHPLRRRPLGGAARLPVWRSTPSARRSPPGRPAAGSREQHEPAAARPAVSGLRGHYLVGSLRRLRAPVGRPRTGGRCIGSTLRRPVDECASSAAADHHRLRPHPAPARQPGSFARRRSASSPSGGRSGCADVGDPDLDRRAARLRLHPRRRVRGERGSQPPAPAAARTPAPTSTWSPTSTRTARARRLAAERRGVDLNRNFPSGWRRDGRPLGPRILRAAAALRAGNAARRARIVALRPEATIWFHQHRGAGPFVRAWGRSARRRRALRPPRRIPFRRMPWPAGTAPNWQNHAFRGTASFVVELPRGQLATACGIAARPARWCGSARRWAKIGMRTER